MLFLSFFGFFFSYYCSLWGPTFVDIVRVQTILIFVSTHSIYIYTYVDKKEEAQEEIYKKQTRRKLCRHTENVSKTLQGTSGPHTGTDTDFQNKCTNMSKEKLLFIYVFGTTVSPVLTCKNYTFPLLFIFFTQTHNQVTLKSKNPRTV